MKTKHFLSTIVLIFIITMTVNAGKKNNTQKTVIYEVSMHCQSCVNKIEKEISFEKGVRNLEINLENKTVKVTYDSIKNNQKNIKTSIEKLGYEVKEKQ